MAAKIRGVIHTSGVCGLSTGSDGQLDLPAIDEYFTKESVKRAESDESRLGTVTSVTSPRRAARIWRVGRGAAPYTPKEDDPRRRARTTGGRRRCHQGAELTSRNHANEPWSGGRFRPSTRPDLSVRVPTLNVRVPTLRAGEKLSRPPSPLSSPVILSEAKDLKMRRPQRRSPTPEATVVAS